MLHNKYSLILEQFLGDYGKEIYGRELIGTVKISQKGIALALEELEKMGILKSRKEGNLKQYGLNLANTEAKDFLVLTEITKKIEFMSKNRKLAHTFKKDDRIVGIFGSYAKGTHKQDSDLDIFVIGTKKTEDFDSQSSKIQTEISPKYFTMKEWKELLKEKNNLAKEILENHLILFGAEEFVNLAWEDYHGFN